MSSEQVTVPAAIVLMPDDNVAVAGRALSAGETVQVGDLRIEVKAAVPLGHKIALRAIADGDKVLRWGVPIGSATQAIAAGEHVHTHNLVSDYIATFTRDGPLKFEEQAP